MGEGGGEGVGYEAEEAEGGGGGGVGGGDQTGIKASGVEKVYVRGEVAVEVAVGDIYEEGGATVNGV